MSETYTITGEQNDRIFGATVTATLAVLSAPTSYLHPDLRTILTAALKEISLVMGQASGQISVAEDGTVTSVATGEVIG